ncbi:MAG: hypothetical protein GX072_11530 [Lysinibacillus sp.]|nr:hypothetical protein [Lysinibacillus sp.]
MLSCIELDEAEFLKGFNNFSSFIHAYTLFIMNFFKSTFSDAQTEELLQLEEQVTQSLLLLEKLHMFLFMNTFTYKKHFTLSENIHPLHNQTNLELLERLQMFISQYNFQKEENRMVSEKTIFQILTYYYSEKDVDSMQGDIDHDKEEDNQRPSIIFTLSPLSPPWLANLPSVQ